MAKGAGSLTLIVFVAVGLVLGYILSNFYSARGYGVHGQITAINVSIYKDSLTLQQLTEIDWGTLDPGEANTTTFYIKSTSNTPITLTYEISDWQPPAAQTYLTLSWDYAGTIIQPSAIQQVKMTLHVSSAVTGIQAFAFNIAIIGVKGA